MGLQTFILVITIRCRLVCWGGGCLRGCWMSGLIIWVIVVVVVRVVGGWNRRELGNALLWGLDYAIFLVIVGNGFTLRPSTANIRRRSG